MHLKPPNAQPLSGRSGRVPSTGPLAGGRQITRNRMSYNCHTCRRRRVKCDKVHPTCGTCAKTGAECVYDVSSRKQEDKQHDLPRSGHALKKLKSIYGYLKRAESSSDQNSGPSAIEARLDKPKLMIKRPGRVNQALEAAEKHSVASLACMESGPVDLRQSNARRGKSISSQPPSSWRAATESSGREFPFPSGQITEWVDPVGSLPLGHLSLSLEDGGRSRYVGPTFWAYISHEINYLNELLQDQNRLYDQSASENFNEGNVLTNGRRPWKPSLDSSKYSSSSIYFRRARQQPKGFPSGDSSTMEEKVAGPEMFKYVPTRRQSHILYEGFILGIHSISPVIHPPTIIKMYNSFWNWYDCSSFSGETCPNLFFIPLLYAIWYGGSVTVSLRTIRAEFNVPSRSVLSIMYREEVTRWLNKISFPQSSSLQGLTAYLIVQTILSNEEEPMSSSLFVSLAMRVAQTMGLHRDPAKFGIEPCEAEYRRRLWWHIMHMDGVVAISTGLPPLVGDEHYWDVRDTSEIKGSLLGTPEAKRYEQLVSMGQRLPDNPDDPSVCSGSSMVDVFYLTAKGKYIMTRAVRHILKIQLGTKPVIRGDMEELRTVLCGLQLELNSIINRIPESKSAGNASGSSSWAFSMSKSPVDAWFTETELPGEDPHGCPEQCHTPVLGSFYKWARIILSLYVDKAFCVAYHPFLKNAHSRVWPVARKSALGHCHAFMEKFLQLVTDPDFQPFQWSWPGNHQPLHATMIMLVDLDERPCSPEASKSRAFIDRMMALCGPDGGVVGGEDGVSMFRPLKEGGREAWDMIRRLRQKAWQKAGLNHQMLWNEQDETQAGIASLAVGPRSLRDSFYTGQASGPESLASSKVPLSPHQPATPDRQLTDFNKAFYDMTRSHIFPNMVLSLVSPTLSSLSYSYQQPSPPQSSALLPTSRYNPVPATVTIHETGNRAAVSAMATSPVAPSFDSPPRTLSHIVHSDIPVPEARQGILKTDSSPQLPLMNSLSSPPMGCQLPPSMVDYNLYFDWDHWDTVFEQHLPVADEMLELDFLSGPEFTNI